MPPTRVNNDYFLREFIPPVRLWSGLAAILGVRAEEIQRLEPGDPESAVLLYHFQHEKGFHSNLQLYIDPQQIPAHVSLDSLDFGLCLAREFGQDVLSGPPVSWGVTNPYSWLLILPSGELFRVKELLHRLDEGDDDDMFIEEDRSSWIRVDHQGKEID
jgi:hypothetical protein